VVAAGICGTDLHIYDGEYESRPPVTMGHEVSGVVAELGDGVDEAWLGARVVTETYFSTCGHCVHCSSGRINLCLERRSIGSFVDGGFARRLHVPARNLHRIPDWLDGTVASLPSRSRAAASRCSIPSGSGRGTPPWWSGQGRSGCSPPLDDWAEAFAATRSGAGIKYVLVP
jgi:threonine dehydrogenase-like Zn-dependent dehydrogenase